MTSDYLFCIFKLVLQDFSFESRFGKYETEGEIYYAENEVINELEFLIDNIFIELV